MRGPFKYSVTFIEDSDGKSPTYYADNFTSQGMMIKTLRALGYSISNRALSSIGEWGSIELISASKNVRCHIEYIGENRDPVKLGSRVFVPINEYCKITQKSLSAVKSAVLRKRIRSILIEKMRYVEAPIIVDTPVIAEAPTPFDARLPNKTVPFIERELSTESTKKETI